ncbi:hypothetical protein SAY87_021492 [Trapa incisa]|uniref:Uncharacterized protein n=1 Tax=Trapa incisa TaxID=236973 RepID=A0AAN7JS22_9MYRT|nr:hypothetical protein SAY87_021492 [Trapa incisa]
MEQKATFSTASIGRSGQYDGEPDNDAEGIELLSNKEVPIGFSKPNTGELTDCFQDDSVAEIPWKVRKEKHEGHHHSMDCDPIVESILSLKSVQESLERELQKFADIGKEPLSHLSENGCSLHCDRLDLEQNSRTPLGILEMQVLTLTENIKNLESKLEEARTTLKVKEAQISEFEAALSQSQLPKGEPGSDKDELELESLFRQKIEAEIEYLIMTRKVQTLRIEEQQSLVDVQSRMRSNLQKMEAETAMLKKQADNLSFVGIRRMDKVLRFQNSTCKASFYLMLQLLLLLVVSWLFILRLSLESAFPAPT